MGGKTSLFTNANDADKSNPINKEEMEADD